MSHPTAYRYLPVMMILCVVLVCVLNRDFGPMLTSERKSSVILLPGTHEEHTQQGQRSSLEGSDEEEPSLLLAMSSNVATSCEEEEPVDGKW